jgi:hypothetical protein
MFGDFFAKFGQGGDPNIVAARFKARSEGQHRGEVAYRFVCCDEYAH